MCTLRDDTSTHECCLAVLQVKEVDSCEFLAACVENLKEGKPYMFRVYAENEVGAGTATELRDSVIPRSNIGQYLDF